ncbi:MAG: TraR/DksA C4-type zinc finger protein [Syntrophomonas sp.]
MDNWQRLQARKNEIEEMIRHKQDALFSYQHSANAELSLYDEHPADLASEVYEREKEQGLLEMLEYELEKVNQSLERHQEGQYGICQICGRAIEPGRLETLVNTDLCANCARTHQMSFHRPVEEEVMIEAGLGVPAEKVDISGHEFYDH